ncbi:MAG: amino acid ABC transporter substrate-binding protein [Lachnospiraceae bacterium]|nr:amino acid ABC transporter substrate-binding protein [Lachnospiraceae bacterium]
MDLSKKRPWLRKKLIFTAMALILVMANGCGSDSSAKDTDQDESLQKVLDSGQLVIGLDEEYPPMGFRDDSGEIVGFDIDVAKEVCNRLGIQLVTKPIDWSEKENELNSGNIDCIWNGMSVTPERAQAMNLSDPYMKNELIFVVSGNSNIESMTDLKGCRIGMQAGSTTLDALAETSLGTEITIVEGDNNIELYQMLNSGSLDAVLVDSIVSYWYISNSDETFYVLPESLREETFAVGFRKEDNALRDRVQELISEMKTDGTLRGISEKWFGSDITIVK